MFDWLLVTLVRLYVKSPVVVSVFGTASIHWLRHGKRLSLSLEFVIYVDIINKDKRSGHQILIVFIITNISL